MSNDISLKNDEEFSTDLTKAVQDIADNVKAGSADFTKGLDSLKSSIEAMQSALVTALNSIKINIVNNYKSDSARKEKEQSIARRKEREDQRYREKMSKPGMPGFVGPKSPYTEKPPKEAYGPSREEFDKEQKKIADEEKATIKAEKAYWKRMNEWSEEVHKEAKKRAKEDEQYAIFEAQLLKEIADEEKKIQDQMASIGKGIGEIFSVTEEQLSGIKKSTKKKKEDKFEMPSLSGIMPQAVPVTKEDLSFAVDLQEYIQSLADDFENELGPAIQSVDPYLLDARSNFRAFQEDLDELAQAAKSVSQPIVEMSDSLAELIKEVDTERIMSKAGPKSLKDVFNIVGASAQPNEQNLPEAIPLSSGGPQSLPDVFRIVAAATQDIPKAQRVYTKDEIAEMQNKPKVFAQQATEQTSGPWQTLFSNINAGIEAKKQKEEGLKSGMEFGPSRQLFEEFNRVKESSREFRESLVEMKDMLLSTVPVLGNMFKLLTSGPLFSLGMRRMSQRTKYKADGGSIFEPKGTDTVPAMLTPGEFVVNAKASKENKKELEAINNGKAKGGSVGYFSSGGSVGYYSLGGVVDAGMMVSGAALNLVGKAAQFASQAINTFAQYLSKSNPATMEQVNLVFNDLNGTIGRALNPTIQYLIPLLRYYADFVDASIKKLKPVMEILAVAFATITKPLLDLAKVVIDFLTPVFSTFAVIVKGVVDVLAPVVEFITAFGVAVYDVLDLLIGWIPIIDIVSGMFDAVAFVMKSFVQGVSFLIASLMTGIGKILSWIPGLGSVGKSLQDAGKKLGDFSMGKGTNVGIEKGSSFGAAVREVQNVSISGIGDEVRKSALMAGANQLSQEQLLSGINDKLNKDALADAFAAGIAKEKGKKMPANPLPKGHDVIAGGEFDLSFQASV